MIFTLTPNIIWVIESRKMRWAGHVARMGMMRNAYKVLVCKPVLTADFPPFFGGVTFDVV